MKLAASVVASIGAIAVIAVIAVTAAMGCRSREPSPAEVCDQIVAKIRATKPAAMTTIVDKLVPAIRASCLEDSWPDDVKACFVAASPDGAALAACDRMLPKAVQDSITHRQLPAN